MLNKNPMSPLLMVVDDEPVNVHLLERLLAKDYRLLTARNGETALELLADQPVDLLLLDIMMPGIGGLEVLQTIRATQDATEMPVILLSALSDAPHVALGLRMGANDYITKPISTEVLLARVQTQLTLKRLYNERKQAIVELENVNEMKERFFRIAAHDLKSPLANISMANYLLRELVPAIPEVNRLFDMIEQCTENMQAVIRDFLDTSAIHGTELDLRPEIIQVDEALHDLLARHYLAAIKKDISLHLLEAEGLVCADPARFAQTLDNLVSNAIKYSARGTMVTVYSEVRGDFVRVSVVDQGPGIPEEERDLLFTQFGKLTARPTQGESSTGLGLWIVKNLVTMQGGHVGVDSVPGEGSTFWVEFPLVDAETECACAPLEQESETPNG